MAKLNQTNIARASAESFGKAARFTNAAANGTALGKVWELVGGDKDAIHAGIVREVGTVLALALVHTAPKGFGNAGDHAYMRDLFEASQGGKRYAPHCAAFPQALKGRMRKVAEWDAACEEGFAIALAAFADLAPKTYTADELSQREAKRTEKKAEREKAAKKAEREARILHRAELNAEYSRGVADGKAQGSAPVLTAQAVADMIQAGAFGADVTVIRAALLGSAAPAPLALTAE